MKSKGESGRLERDDTYILVILTKSFMKLEVPKENIEIFHVEAYTVNGEKGVSFYSKENS